MAELFFRVDTDYTKLIKLQQEVAKLETQLRALDLNITPKVEVSALEGKLKNARAEMEGLYKNAAMAGKAITSIGGANFNNSGIKGVVSNLNSATSSARNLRDSMRDVGNATSGIASGVGQFTRQFTAAALAFKGITTTIAAIKDAMGTIVSFQAENSRLQAILGEGGENMDRLRNSAMELGRQTVFTSSQVTQLQIELSKLGFATDDILNMSEPLIQFSMAVGSNLADAASTAGAAIRMFGGSTEDTARYVGAMSGAINRSALNFQAVSDNLATFGPVAKSVGMDIEDALAIFGKLKDAGYEGSTAATSVRNILNEMAGGKLKDAIGGMPIKSIEDFVEALKRLEAAGYAGEEGVAKAMKGVGKRGGAQLLTLIQAANDAENGLVALRDKIVQSEDGMGKLADTMNDNVAGAIKKLSSAWEGFILQFSDSTGPAANMINFITEGINGLTDSMTGKTNETFFDTAIFGLTELIGLMVAYKLQTEGISVMERLRASYGTAQVASYEMQATALAKLKGEKSAELAIDLKEAVAKGALTEEQAAYIASLRAEAIEQKKLAAEKLALIDADIAETTAKMKSATAAEMVELNTKKSLLLKEREVAQGKLVAASNIAEATAKNINTKATNVLRNAAESLKASLAANPYMLAVAAIIALGTAIISYANHTTAAEKAQEDFNKIMSDSQNAIDTHRQEINSLIRDIKDETKTNYERYESYKKLKELLKGTQYEGMTYDEVNSMGEKDMSKMSNLISINKENEALERRVKIYDELAKKGNKNTGVIGGWSISEGKMNDVLDKAGVVDKEEREAYLEQLNAISRWEGDSEYFLEMLERTKEGLRKIKGDQAIAELNAKFKDVANTMRGSNDALEEFRLAMNKVTQADVTNGTWKDYSDEMEKAMSDARSNISRLQLELASATGEKRAEIKVQLGAARDTLEYMEQIKDGLRNGTLDWKAILELKATMNFDDIQRASSEVGEKIADAYEKSDNVLAKYRKDLMDLAESHQESGKTAEEASKLSEGAQKDVRKSIKSTQSEIDKLTEKLNNGKLTGAERAKIEFDRSELMTTKENLEAIILMIEEAVKDPKHMNLDIILSYLTSDGKTVGTDKNGLPLFNWGDNKFNGGGKQTVNAPYVFGGGDPNQRFKYQSSPKKEEDNSNEGGDDKSSAINAAADARNKEKKYQELLKTNAESRKELIAKLEQDIADARIDAAQEGFDKYVRQRENQRKKEEDALNKEHEKRVKDFIAMKKKEWESDPRNQEVKAKDADKNGNGGVGYKAAAEFNEESYKKTEEYLAFVRKSEEVLNSKRSALTTKYLDDLTKGYETAEDKRRKKSEEILGGIILMEKELSDARAKGDETAVNYLEQRIELAKALKKIEEVNANEERYKSEYGSLQDRIDVARAQGQREMSKARESGDVYGEMLARADMEKKISDINFDEIKKNLDWESVFNDLDKISMKSLANLKNSLNELLSNGNLDAKDLDVIYEKIGQINERISEKKNENRLFDFTNPFLVEKERLEGELAAWEERLKNTTISLGELKLESTILETDIKSILGEGVDVRDKTSIASSYKGDKNGDEYKKLLEMSEKLVKNEVQIDKLGSDAEKAAKKVEDFGDKLDEATKNTLENIRKKVAGFADSLKGIADNISSVPELTSALGIDTDSKIGKIAESVADAGNKAMGAMSDFASGNYIGAVAKGIGAVMSAGKALGTVFGIGGGNAEYVAKTTERLTESNKYLMDSIDGLSKKMSESKGGMEAIMLYKEAAEDQRKYNENQRKILEVQSGYTSAHHSNSYNINKEFNTSDWLRIGNLVGKNVRSADDLVNLTPEQLDEIRTHDAEMWQKIVSTGKYDKEEYWNTYADLAGKLDELEKQTKEKLTGTTFDSMYSSFVSNLMNMDKKAEDFADDFKGYMQQAMLNSAVSDILGASLKEFYDDWGDKMMAGKLDRGDIDAMSQRWDEMVQQGIALRDNLAAVTGYESSESKKQDQGSSRAFKEMSQDTGDEMNGRLTAIQIAVEAIRGILERSGVDASTITTDDIIRASSEIPTKDADAYEALSSAINAKVGDVGDTGLYNVADEIRTILANSYLELVDINANTGSIVKPIRQMSADIAEMKDKMKKSF